MNSRLKNTQECYNNLSTEVCHAPAC